MRLQSWQQEQSAHQGGWKDTAMRQLLIHATTFARIEAALQPFSDQISPLVLDDQGHLTHPWGESEAKPAIVYGTQDAYFSPAVVTFFQTLLGFDQLDWFQSSAAGTEHPMIQATGKHAQLFTGSHEQSEAIAEWVVWAALDFCQDGKARRQAQAEQNWTRLPFRELSSTKWLIFGFGAIGQACGKRLRALGAHVIGVRRSGGTSGAADQIILPSQAHEILPAADIILLSLPLTDETENTADAAFFAQLKPGTLLLNVGRGALVDEEAMIAALDEGRLAQAYLDVVREEPLSKESPIWQHPNIMLTPHIAALTEESMLRTDKVFLENLQRFLAGKPLHNTVPKDVFS
jgi:phosphoglycerate dehydrogenase-like enzyme